MEVLADPVAFFDHRESSDGLVQPRVLDRDAGMQREELGQPLVVVAELVGRLLVREVEVTDDPALDPHGHAEERSHRGVLRRKTRARGVRADVGDTERVALGDDQSEESMTLRQGPESPPLLGRDPARDEALDAPPIIDDAERRVLRTDQGADAIDDELEHGLDVELACHGADGVTERLECDVGGGIVGVGHVETVPRRSSGRWSGRRGPVGSGQVGRDDEDRTRSVAHDSFGDRTAEQASDPASPVRADHDQVDVFGLGGRHDRFARFARPHQERHRDPECPASRDERLRCVVPSVADLIPADLLAADRLTRVVRLDDAHDEELGAVPMGHLERPIRGQLCRLPEVGAQQDATDVTGERCGGLVVVGGEHSGLRIRCAGTWGPGASVGTWLARR